VETKGPTTEHGGEEPGTNNNVVPFPRDWLGPREELIPFGSSAGYGVEQSAAAPGAEAFWGGDSGPLHVVLPEPVTAGGAAGARLRTRAGRLAVAGLAAAVLAAAVFGRFAGLPAGSSPSVGSGVAAAGFFDLALLRGAVGAPAIESSKPAVHRSPAVHARPTAHVRHRRAADSRTSGRGSTAAASSATTPAATPATSTSQTVSSTGSSSSASEPPATSSAPTHSSVSSHTATVRPGPVGPGAPFGPGQLK
jgi:hypothetical protein